MNDKNKNLLVRVVTALVLLPLVLFLIWQGGFWFALLLGVAAALCALELNLLPTHLPKAAPVDEPAPLSRKQRQKAHREPDEVSGTAISGAAILSVGGAFLLPLIHDARFHVAFLTVETVLVAIVIVSFADALLLEENLFLAPRRVSMALLGAVYPGLLISALVALRDRSRGEWWIVLTLVVTWFNDTGAYFSGRAFGKRKLYPRISPSKTWEGAIGGGLASIAGAIGVQQLWLKDELGLGGAVIIGVGAAVLGPLGDLSESMLKRAFGAKDSGKLLPGHGGMLDRIDALLFNAPFVLLCARLLTSSG